jgi:hypothetical protein
MAWGQEMEWAGEWDQAMALITMARQLAGLMGHAADKEIAGGQELALRIIPIAGAMEHVAKAEYAGLTQLASIMGLVVRRECVGREPHAWRMEHAAETDIVGEIRHMQAWD